MAPSPATTPHRLRRPLAIVLGTSEIASAIGVHLHRDGWGVVLSHDPQPPVLRRGMAFHDALWGDPATVEGVAGRAVEGILDLLDVAGRGEEVGVTRMGLVDLMPLGPFDLLVDARLHKYAVTPDLRPFAVVTIGLGPGFAAGVDCDVAVETRPARLGLLRTRGATEPPDGCPPLLGGVGEDRFVRADDAGLWRTAFPLGARVFRGQLVGRLGRAPIAAPMDGMLRGLVRDDTEVPAGAKLIEIDPRNRWAARWTGIDDRGRAIAETTARAAADLLAETRATALSLTTPFVPRSPR